MSDPAIRSELLSVEDYLALEETASIKHEYVAGQIYAMTGVTARHNRIALAIARHLANAAGDGPSRVYASDVKVQTTEDAFYYPDVLVVCDEHDPGSLVMTAPCMIAEVLSPSTEAIDHREKLAAYTRIPTMRAYLIVHQDVKRVERYWRNDQGTWSNADVFGKGRLPVPCPEAKLTLDDIYRGIELPPRG